MNAPNEEQFVEESPIIPHINHDFLLWLWWRSDTGQNLIELDNQEIGFQVDSKVKFIEEEESVTVHALSPETSPEVIAALQGNRRVQEYQVEFTKDELKYSFTLSANPFRIKSIKLPQETKNGEEALYERMYLYNILVDIIDILFYEFATLRVGEFFEDTVLKYMEWVISNES